MAENFEKVLDIHMKSMNQRMDRTDQLLEKIFDRQDKFSVILERNTITTEEHQARSVKLEESFDKMKDSVHALENKLIELEKDTEVIKQDLIPIKKHVIDVTKTLSLVTGIPNFVKFLIILIGGVSSIYGLAAMVMKISGK